MNKRSPWIRLLVGGGLLAVLLLLLASATWTGLSAMTPWLLLVTGVLFGAWLILQHWLGQRS